MHVLMRSSWAERSLGTSCINQHAAGRWLQEGWAHGLVRGQGALFELNTAPASRSSPRSPKRGRGLTASRPKNEAAISLPSRPPGKVGFRSAVCLFGCLLTTVLLDCRVQSTARDVLGVYTKSSYPRAPSGRAAHAPQRAFCERRLPCVARACAA